MLRDQLVCGINNEGIQNKLLAEADLTYGKALDIARSLEVAAQNLQDLRSTSRTTGNGVSQHDINKVHARNTFKKSTGKGGASSECYRCGKPGHLATACRFKDSKCYLCGKIGHLKQVCKSCQKGDRKDTLQKSVCRLEEEEEEVETHVYNINSLKGSVDPLKIEVKLDGCSICMEIDTGATMSVMSETTFNQLWPGRCLSATDVRLCSYTKEPISVLGCVEVKILYHNQTANLPLLVVEGRGPSLFGRNWLKEITLNWKFIHQIANNELEVLLSKYKDVFREELGTLKGFQAHIELLSNASPRFCKARTVPYALRDKMEETLKTLVEEGTLEPVGFSNWAAPIVPVLKSDK